MMAFGADSRISWTMCKQYAPHLRLITTPTPHHSIFKGRILVLTPIQQCQRTEGKSSEGKSLQHHIKLLIFSSVRPSTPFLADTDRPIFCCQSNTIPIRYRFFDTLQERTWRHVTDRSKAPDAAAATNNSGAPRTCCSTAADAFDLSWTVKHSNYQ